MSTLIKLLYRLTFAALPDYRETFLIGKLPNTNLRIHIHQFANHCANSKQNRCRTMNATTNNQPPRKNSAPSAPANRPATTFAESDELRRVAQLVAVARSSAQAEQRIESEMLARLAEWSAAARYYMDTECQIAELYKHAKPHARSEYMDNLLTAASLEIKRCVPSLEEAVRTLSALTGTNISGPSIKKVRTR